MSFCIQGISLPFRFRPETPMTDDELMHFCAANEVFQVERDANGEISVMTPSGGDTGRKNAYVTRELFNWSEADGHGLSFDSNTGFTLPRGSMRSPDASWVLATRWDALTKEERSRFAPICPDFIIELRSPTDRLGDLQAKMEEWIANGAQLAWLLDPQSKAVTIYRPNHPPELLEQPESVHGEGPVAGFELPLARIFN